MTQRIEGNSTGLTLVLGGTGKTGSRVVQRLAAQGMPVRVGSRSGEPPFDWDVPTTWVPALHGVRSVYVTYQPDLGFPGASETIALFTQLAVSMGVQRLVLLSGRNEEGAQLAEKTVQGSGAEWTIIRASTFAQNFSEGFMVEPIQYGELAFPAGDVAEPFIDVEDIADIAFEALTGDRHVGRLYEVTGPRLWTFAEALAEIGAAAGRDVTYRPVNPAEFVSLLTEGGIPREFATLLAHLFQTIFDGRNASVTDGVEQALGRKARDFSEYVRRAAASGVWSAPIAA